jgi:transposase
MARSCKYSLKRIEAKKLKEKGVSNTAIAQQLQVSRATVINWLKKGNSNE